MELEARVAQLEHLVNAYRSDSRRGLEGPRGQQGDPGRPGVGIQGERGLPGKDADINEVVSASKQIVTSELAQLKQELHALIVAELQNKQGASGRDGVDGKSIVGPKGDSVTGPKGRDGRDAKITIGNVTSGDEAKAVLRDTEQGQVLDLVLPRGERGLTGATGATGRDGRNGIDGKNAELKGDTGPRGPAGNIDAAVANALDAIERRLAEFRNELLTELKGVNANT